MRPTVKVSVTEDDIRMGVKGARYHCPIALALSRAFPLWVQLESWSASWCYLASPVDEFIAQFDEGKPVSPFEFEFTPGQMRGAVA